MIWKEESESNGVFEFFFRCGSFVVEIVCREVKISDRKVSGESFGGGKRIGW